VNRFEVRPATLKDLPRLREVMDLAIAELQRGFLTGQQVVASAAVMGLDTQLIVDGTYFVVEAQGRVAGCGGWSWRRTLFGGDHSAAQRDPGILDPAADPARVRAMYTHPHFARQGVGRLLLAVCEDAAAAAGFGSVELMATLSGEPLYRAAGYQPVEHIVIGEGASAVPLIRMSKRLAGQRDLAAVASISTR
jgi:GNAT superfamily N-acetyltransferase